MKKILAALMLFGLSFSVNAQELGVRFGNVAKNNFGVDAVFSAGEFSRIHADVAFGDGLGIDALFDFVYRPLADTPLNWYAGVGPSMNIGHDDAFWIGASGEIGLEYKFDDIPLSLSADFRPTLWIVDKTQFYPAFGLNARYVF